MTGWWETPPKLFWFYLRIFSILGLMQLRSNVILNTYRIKSYATVILDNSLVTFLGEKGLCNLSSIFLFCCVYIQRCIIKEVNLQIFLSCIIRQGLHLSCFKFLGYYVQFLPSYNVFFYVELAINYFLDNFTVNLREFRWDFGNFISTSGVFFLGWWLLVLLSMSFSFYSLHLLFGMLIVAASVVLWYILVVLFLYL